MTQTWNSVQFNEETQMVMKIVKCRTFGVAEQNKLESDGELGPEVEESETIEQISQVKLESAQDAE